MNKITAVLIDDETFVLKGLKNKIEKLFPNVSIIATFSQPEEAITYLSSNSPDIVFLDIQMPRYNGFDLLEEIKNISFQLIFVTAYSEFGLKALKASALDYLLKPIDEKELKNAIEKAIKNTKKDRNLMQQEKLINLFTQSFTDYNKIIIPTTKGISFIQPKELLHLEGYEGYTKFHLTKNEVITSSYNLGKFEKKLPNYFFKCHKSHIVNLNNMKEYENDGYIVLSNEKRVPISKTYKKLFINLIDK